MASGRGLQRDGQPITDQAARVQILQQASDAFVAGRLPMLVAAGVAEPA